MMTITRETTLGFVTACLIACGGPSDTAHVSSAQPRAEELVPMQAYIWSNLGYRTYQAQDLESSVGVFSNETEQQLAALIAHGVSEGLIEPPDCLELEAPNHVPSTLLGGLHITPTSITVEVLPDCETVLPVPEEFDGVTDYLWSDEVHEIPFSAYCEPSQDAGSGEAGVAQEMLCGVVEEYDQGRTVSYFEPTRIDAPAWEVEGETECGSDAICKIVELELWPMDPRTDEPRVFEVDCLDNPQLCQLKIDMVDPNILVSDDPPAEDLEPKNDDCNDMITQYNTGEIGCSAEVARCAAGGSCHTETDDGYVSCDEYASFNNATCTTCYQKDESGKCVDATTNTFKNPKDDDPNGIEEDIAAGHFDDTECGRGHCHDSPTDSVYNHDDGRWHDPKGAECWTVGSGEGTGPSRVLYDHQCK